MSALREARLASGMSIEEAARKIGISGGYMSEIELGKRKVSPERADELAKLYGKEKEDIFLPARYALREVLDVSSA